jgi:restriction endonuclease S subunit
VETFRSEENQRMAKELTKLEKKCIEIRNGIEKMEKEIEEAFQNWEQRQFKKRLENEERAAAARKKNEGCDIY